MMTVNRDALSATPSRLVLVAAALALLACDPPGAGTKKTDAKAQGAKGGKADKGDKADEGAAGEAEAGAAEAGAAGAGAAVEQSQGECIAACDAAESSEDDKATCRLRCKNAHGGAKEPTAVGRYMGCFDGCADKSETDRATCEKNCAASVTAGAGAPEASKCARSCLESLGSCLGPCEGKGEDDRATCQLQCKSSADKCVAGCDAG
ncbi:hypothetical protein G6O69_31300 [Pseudenhygromyxa sp. WMMC2535]|uniref:hypothetical protein n=1 Tax=Pseudenhygromyxa sp. WMMC2535 TaxID=2712867 RepID=UPI001553C355|nr:hypothetical protein [Pseudenhygromyxa sp. WMMC2535]NVB42351.1 hypothetical protein [Pseudenhygromyxa sp. WMMC2535]